MRIIFRKKNYCTFYSQFVCSNNVLSKEKFQTLISEKLKSKEKFAYIIKWSFSFEKRICTNFDVFFWTTERKVYVTVYKFSFE